MSITVGKKCPNCIIQFSEAAGILPIVNIKKDGTIGIICPICKCTLHIRNEEEITKNNKSKPKAKPKKKKAPHRDQIKLNVGDFFHVQVVETAISETAREPDVMLIKLQVMDGPYKKFWLYFDSRINPNLRNDR